MKLIEAKDCYGCSACVNACPQNAITLDEALRPVVDPALVSNAAAARRCAWAILRCARER